MFIKIPELLQQHFPSVYLCTYSIVSLLWAGHSFCSIIHLLTHFSSPSLLSFFCLDPVLFFCSCFLYLLTHPRVFTCLHFSISRLFRLFQHLFVCSPYRGRISQNVTVNSRSNTQLHKHADGGIKVYVQ